MKKIESFEGDRVSHYDNSIRKWFPGYDNLIELLFPLLKSRLAPTADHKILVVGCGSGNELNILARLRPEWEFVGVDPSEQMIALATEKTAKLPNVRLIKGTVENVNESFDAITCILVTHFFEIEVKKEIYHCIYKHLNEGGIFILADITGSKNSFNKNFDLFKTYQELNIDDDTLPKGLNHIVNDLHYIAEEELISLLKSEGFKKVTKFFQWLIYDAWLVEK
ncbi:class I SAM-dependent methyltransferase [Desertivirga brevis]|uniref:class I SAM-dependent methyltransferase n=1 Tax=Desertivirga brevis TaxID=2810310 RepID=UPI001A95D217|nr:class I SAM-dependent methyltransferase [Pedobacter sp. SYSU D00873]